MALQIGALVTAISNLSVSGVTILDDNAIPPNAELTRKQVMFPEPSNFVTDFTVTYDSFGMFDVAKMTVTYTLNYTYCHVPVGEGRTGLDKYSGLVTTYGLIMDALLRNTITTVIDVRFPTVQEFGVVPDPSGAMYLGCRVSVLAREFVN